MHRSSLLAVTLTLTQWTNLGAQQPINTTALPGLRSGQIVRVRMRSGDRIEGRIQSVRVGTLTLVSHGFPLSLPDPSIDSLWVRGSAAGTGAIVGAIAGGLPLYIIGAADCGSLSPFSCPRYPDSGGWTAVLTLAGAAGGALVGVQVGAAITKWRLHYPRTPPPVRLAVDVRNGLKVGVSVRL